MSVHLGLHQDETAEKILWHINEAHYLETWGDGVAFEGTASIAQPLIAPLYSGKSAIELVSALADESPRTSHQIVQEYWADRRKQSINDSDFQQFWRKALNDGVIPGTKVEPVKEEKKEPERTWRWPWEKAGGK